MLCCIREQGQPGGDVCSVAVGVGSREGTEVRVEGGEPGACEEGMGSDEGLQAGVGGRGRGRGRGRGHCEGVAFELCFTALQYSFTALQLYSFTALQLYSFTALQQYSFTAIQLYSNTALQQYSFTAIQLYSNRPGGQLWMLTAVRICVSIFLDCNAGPELN